MRDNRWWHIFFATIMAVLAGLLVVPPIDAPRVGGGFVVLLVLVFGYLTIGRAALHTRRYALSFSLLLIVASGALVACTPNGAIVQGIAFPLIWTVLDSTRRAIIANVALAVSVSIGFVVGLGATPEIVAQTAVIESLSLVGSLALGMWITRIAELSHERQRLLDELTATQEQLALANRDTGVTSERERLAREIHDTIAQSLTGVVMLSQQAKGELASGNLHPLAEHLELLEQSARDALVETRSLVAANAPVELGAGIVPAVERLAARFERETDIRVTVSTTVEASLDRDSEVVLLRCAQEALSNVRKHSCATTATIELVATEISVTLTVRDDGGGFEVTAPEPGFGLSGMRNRLALVDGSLVISSSAAGTELVVSLPVAVAA